MASAAEGLKKSAHGTIRNSPTPQPGVCIMQDWRGAMASSVRPAQRPHKCLPQTPQSTKGAPRDNRRDGNVQELQIRNYEHRHEGERREEKS